MAAPARANPACVTLLQRTDAESRIAPRLVTANGTALAALAVCVLLIEGVLIWLTTLMPLTRFFPGPGVSLGFVEMLGPNWVRSTLIQVAAFTLLFLAFLPSLWLLQRVQRSRAVLLVLFGAPVIWALTAAWMYPPYAVDLFHNLADSRLLWIYHLNPLITAPSARPFPINISFMGQSSAYGPFWYLLSFPPALLEPHNQLLALVVLKLWMALFYLASGGVVYLVAQHVRSSLALPATALFLWNPFVIIRALGDAHNDVVMIFFMLLAFYCVARRWWVAVMPALMLAILVKYVPLLLAPLIVMYVLRLPPKERRPALPRLLAGGFLALLLAASGYLIFWAGSRTFSSLQWQNSLMITSTPLLLQYFITDRLFPFSGAVAARFFTEIVFLVLYAALAWHLRPARDRLAGAAYGALLLYLLIAAAWFRPWYLLWVVALGALLPWGWYLALTLTLSYCAMFPDMVEQYRMHIPWLLQDQGRLLSAPVLVAFLAPALVGLAAAINRRSLYLDDRRGAAPAE